MTVAVLCTYCSEETNFDVLEESRGPICQTMAGRNGKALSSRENKDRTIKQSGSVQ